MGRGRFGGCSYRQLNYRQNYESEKVSDGDVYFPIVLAVGICSPFIAAIILNPYMWIAGAVIFMAYKAINYKEGK